MNKTPIDFLEYIKSHRVNCKHTEDYKDMINWNGNVVCVKCIGERYSQVAYKRIFDKFDKYACIKDDDWYKKFKEEINNG